MSNPRKKSKYDIYAIAIIPAKGTSNRLPGKNLKKIKGKTLVEYAINYAKSSTYMHEIYVSTDSKEIELIAKKNDVIAVKRPEELLGEAEVTDIYVDLMRKIDNGKITHVVGLQPDHPDRQNKLDDMLYYFVKNKYMDLVTVDKTGRRNGSVRIIKADNVRSGIMSRRVGAMLDDCTNVEFEWQLENAKKNIERGKYYGPKNIFIQSLENKNKLRISTDLKKTFQFPLGGKTIGKDLFIISGPCSVESEEMIVSFSKKLQNVDVDALRGGAYKPCTFPVRESVNGWKEGLKEKGLEYLGKARKCTGLPIVSEMMDARQLDIFLNYVDVIQVGARNFQNYTLLDELGKIDKPVLLKRGPWGSIDEILGSAERILEWGNEKVMICLRGVVGMPSYRHVFPSIRWAPDIMMIPALKEVTNLPIIYDPSHSTGYRNFVPAISKAAIAAGADGLIIEAHPNPALSISDPDQAITIEMLDEIIQFCRSFST